ncbi:hypothetical protein LWI29_011112 [Acer saccharum]|uniref:Transmembrane 9 superfamily member n=1 Tax=Acer saccharum TaxID=4024 RepID=A0AA39SSQ2_ACESA|nr:hypothetical protein LWI29_011112 [Acer saccharum]
MATKLVENSCVLVVFLLTVLGFAARLASSSPYDHRYNVGDHIPLFVNKIGPLNNPSETYQYYDLPFCSPDPISWKKETLGEVLNGDHLTSALYKLKFLEDKTGDTLLCQKKLKGDEVARFRQAIIDDFYFQMYYDDLPLWGYIGKIEDESWMLSEKGKKYYLFTHVQFDAFYNGNHIIEIRAFSDPNHVVDITEDGDINVKFTYSVFWNVTSAPFETRMDKYSRASAFAVHRQIHWFSVINSLVIIVLLMGLLILLFMRRLMNDLRKCSIGDEEEDKEVGWKFIHGDVFRHPQNLSLFSAVLGVGNQLLTMICILFVLAFLGFLYPYNRGLLCTSLVFIYTLTSVVGGYSAASFHNQFSNTGWEKSVLLAGILYLGPLFVTVLTLNTIAISYGATAALPFATMIVILLIYTFLCVPLLALGGVIGYRCLTYIQLSAEDHEWWWRSIFCGGSTAIFMFCYSIFFYVRSTMSGFMQLSFFLGYNAAMCYAFFLIFGAISFRTSLIFVRHIYQAVKSE